MDSQKGTLILTTTRMGSFLKGYEASYESWPALSDPGRALDARHRFPMILGAQTATYGIIVYGIIEYRVSGILSLYIYMYMYTYICIYIYVYIYVDVYIYVCM